MRRLVAVSPHLDDAAFSAGGTLAAHARDGWRVTIVTCFAGNVARPAGFALACQLDKGLAPDVDYMALRRAEDRAACAVIGAEPVHLPFLEAPHRGYGDAAALFDPARAGDDVAARLAPVLATLVGGADLVLGPLALGDHVDHRAVRAALAEVGPLLLWEDWPYLDRAAAPATPARTLSLDAELKARRLAMCASFESQLGFQFGGRAGLDARLAGIVEERLHRP